LNGIDTVAHKHHDDVTTVIVAGLRDQAFSRALSTSEESVYCTRDPDDNHPIPDQSSSPSCARRRAARAFSKVRHSCARKLDIVSMTADFGGSLFEKDDVSDSAGVNERVKDDTCAIE
jgi:hypothetical protein